MKDGARIKVWPNTPSKLSTDLQGGGGKGRVNNVTYDTMYVDNVDYAIEITQCYGQSDTNLCLKFPSPLTITNITFKNFFGRTSKKFSPQIAKLACSSKAVCNNIEAINITAVSPAGTKDAYCLNVEEGKLPDLKCTGGNQGGGSG